MRVANDNILMFGVLGTIARVRRWVMAEKKFDITWGKVENSDFENSITLVRPDPIKKRNRIFWVLKLICPREFFGTLWFDGLVNTNPHHWVFDVYGRKNLEEAQQLVFELMKKSRVPITIRLNSNRRRYEPFSDRCLKLNSNSPSLAHCGFD